MRRRLSLLMFLVWAVPGALLPLYSVRLHRLGFSAMEVACCCATQAAASVLAALLAGHAADRWLPAERLLVGCALLAGLDLWALAELTAPAAVFAVTLLFWLLAGPTTLLCAAACFAHLRRPERDYGPVRMWGTVGWVASGWLLGYWFTAPAWLAAVTGGRTPDLADTCRLGGLLAFLLAGYALTLPPTPPRRNPAEPFAPLEALRLLRGGPFAVYCVCLFGACATLAFTTQGTPLLLARLGVPPRWLAAVLTVAQATEVVALGLLPLLLARLGLRGTMLLGLTAWLAAQAALAVGRPAGLVIASLGLHGLCIAGFFAAGQVFVNRAAHGGLRASVQALLTFVNGLGLLAGNLLVGWLRRQAGGELPHVFVVGTAVTAGLLLLFLAGFRGRAADDEPAPSAPCPAEATGG